MYISRGILGLSLILAACAQGSPTIDAGDTDAVTGSDANLTDGSGSAGDGPPIDAAYIDAAAPPDACPCLAGLCCDGCDFRLTSEICVGEAYDVRYQCAGTECGGNAEYQEQYQYCDGTSAQCGIDNLIWHDWQTLDDCTTNSLCESDGASATCAPCPSGCAGSSCVCGQGANVAPAAVASISAGSPDQVTYGPQKMNDGQYEPSCGWCWFTAPAPPTPWMQLSWPSPRELWGFSVDTVNQSSASCIYTDSRTLAGGTVQWWNGASWVTDGTVSGKTNDWEYQFSSPVTTTSIRLYNAYSSPNDNPVVFEWQAFSCN